MSPWCLVIIWTGTACGVCQQGPVTPLRFFNSHISDCVAAGDLVTHKRHHRRFFEVYITMCCFCPDIGNLWAGACIAKRCLQGILEQCVLPIPADALLLGLRGV